MRFENAIEALRLLHQAGVPIVAGTDANATAFAVEHGAALHTELGLLAEAGLSPLEVLTAATSGAASAFRLDDRGSIDVGKRADLLLLSADPLDDLAATNSIEAVWIAGVRVTASAE